MNSNHASRIANALTVIGVLVVLATSLMAGNLGALLFALWALVPWGLLFLAGRFVSNPWIVGGAGALALAAELGIRGSVFLFPRGSTAAIALVFSPVLIGLLLLVGGALGFILGCAWRAGGVVVRGGIVLLAAAALGLIVLGLARPDLFPTTVALRRATLKRIGEPRVLRGGDAFEKVVVSERSAWHVVGEFDGEPGDEIAVVRHRRAELFDPTDFSSRGGVEFGEASTPLWNWFSTLARLDERLVVVQTGGGYSQTEVRELDGRLLWRHRPDPTLPPTALRPADLDADGELEFYASENAAMVRLDEAGREVWRRHAVRSHLVAVVQATKDAPAWVVGSAYQDVVSVWGANGDLLGELSPPERAALIAVVDWPEQRTLVFRGDGGKTARGLGFDGEPLFEIPLPEDFTLSAATTARFSPAVPPYLVLTAAAARDVERWRLLILSPAGETVYDEVLGRSVGLLKARTVENHEALFLSGGALRSLRPIARP